VKGEAAPREVRDGTNSGFVTLISRIAKYSGNVWRGNSMTMAVNHAFRALADPTRRRILRLLRERPRTSGEIADAFQSSWPTISRHLAVLRAAGLIVRQRKGQFIEYDVSTTVLQEVIELLLDAVPDRRSRWRSSALPSPVRSPRR
jgi:DNA-binding transcriptional ArsR family regulator